MLKAEPDATARKTLRKLVNSVFISKDGDGESFNSGKMNGLVDLLKQCGMIEEKFDGGADEEKQGGRKKKGNKEEPGTDAAGLLSVPQDDDIGGHEDTDALEADAGGHRALIFCQMKSYLNMIVEHILVPYGIKYTELHSALTGQQRFDVVEQYNNDSSIKIMIMTTAVGGLGLNLTGADTVIFMEHDWNPMKDKQAIDRAHRLGQKRTVNVYRLVLRDSLEEQIMGLQNFKKNLANHLIDSN